MTLSLMNPLKVPVQDMQHFISPEQTWNENVYSVSQLKVMADDRWVEKKDHVKNASHRRFTSSGELSGKKNGQFKKNFNLIWMFWKCLSFLNIRHWPPFGDTLLFESSAQKKANAWHRSCCYKKKKKSVMKCRKKKTCKGAIVSL